MGKWKEKFYHFAQGLFPEGFPFSLGGKENKLFEFMK